MRVFLKTLGCRLNEAELESWSRDFHALGVATTQKPEQADILVINTCAVTEEAVRKSRKLLRRAQRDNPGAKLVVSGCYASLSPEQMEADLGVDLVVPNEQKSELASRTLKALNLPTQPANVMDEPGFGLLAQNRHRAFIKVQDGCRYRCSYCIVTLARGSERSVPVDDIIGQIHRLQDEGIQEVVLAGVHLGGYGSDSGSSLKTLIATVLEHTDIPRLRLGSLEPWDLPDDFWALFANPRLMPHMHLPMQSGADSVLRRMSRRCRSDEFLQLAETARAQVPLLNITTDIIVGFPGETDSEWQQTLDFVRAARFGHVHIFAFSPRSGTKAAYLPNPVERDIKRQRSEELHQLAAKIRQDLLRSQLGRSSQVLIEGRPDSPGSWYGYTENYLRVRLETEAELENRIVRVELSEVDGELLLANRL